MPARKVHLGAACLEARAVNEILRTFSQYSGLLYLHFYFTKWKFSDDHCGQASQFCKIPLRALITAAHSHTRIALSRLAKENIWQAKFKVGK